MGYSDFSYHGPVVVFDLDDTLIHEREYCRSGFREIEKRLVDSRSKEFIGISKRLDSALRRRSRHFDLLEEILDYANGKFDIPEIDSKYKDDLISLYRNHISRKNLMSEGATELLSALSGNGIKMGLITDGRSVTQRAKIESAGLNRYFEPENIYISEETGYDKGSLENFCDIVRKYPEANKFVYVGDNERKDFIVPNMLGWKTICVKYEIDNVYEKFESSDILQAPAVRNIKISEILQEI